jgi:energy-converting hydrogenase Eha subunit A
MKKQRGGGALTNEQKMKIFLRYICDPGFQSGVAEDIGVHQTTVSKVIADIATKIVEKAPLWIKFPSTEEEFEAAKADWQVSYKFPCAIGALDCTHVPVRSIGMSIYK